MAINTISNLPGGTANGWYQGTAGTDARFKSVSAGTGISVTPGANDITVTLNTAATLTWTGTQSFGSYARFDPAYGDFYVSHSVTLPPNPATQEYNAFGADIELSTGTSSLVPVRAHALVNGSFAPNAWGIATEAVMQYAKADGSTNQLFGGEFAVVNRSRKCAAVRHAGVLSVFKNRGDGESDPVGTLPTGGDSYNKKTRAIYIDSGGRGTTSTVECGWQTGIYFDAKSLDSAGSDGKAVGVDLTPLQAVGPEGAPFLNRVKSGVALPTGMPMTLSNDYTSAQLRFLSTTGNTEISNNGSQRFAVNKDNGCVYISAAGESANTWLMDLIGLASPSAIFKFKSGTRVATTATAGGATHVAPAGYLKINIDGVPYKLAYYKD